MKDLKTLIKAENLDKLRDFFSNHDIATLNDSPPNYTSPLSYATGCGKNKVVDFFVEEYWQLLSQKDKNAALAYYAMRGETTKVEKCLDGGAEINPVDQTITPLHSATKNEHADTVKLLISRGADVNKGERYGETPFMGALKTGNAGIIDIYMGTKRINYHLVDEENGTPLTYAIFSEQFDIAFKLIEEEGVNFKVSDHPEALNWAIRKNRKDLVEAMLRYSADGINNPGGKTTNIDDISEEHSQEDSTAIHLRECNDLPLNWATALGYEDIVDLLLEKGAQPETKNLGGVSAKELTQRNDYKFSSIRARLFSHSSHSPTLFHKSPVQQTDSIPGEIGELFDGAFALLLESLNELSDASDKNILLNLLQNNEMKMSEICSVARLIDDQLGSSFDVLCAAIQNNWGDPEVTIHKKELIDNMARHCLPKEASNAELERIAQELKKRAHLFVKQYLQDQKISKLSEEERVKLHALTTKTQSQEKPQEIIVEYLKEFEKDEFKFSLPEFYKTPGPIKKEIDKDLIAKICENYSVANTSWKEIYKLVGKTPTGRKRDELHTCNLVKAILYKESKGISWRDLPQKFPNFSSVYYHYRQWAKALPQIHSLLMQDPVSSKIASLESSSKQQPTRKEVASGFNYRK